MNTLFEKKASFGPYVDGRRVTAWGYPGLPGWAWESLLVQGEPGSGAYMTLPRGAAIDHPWLGELRNHPMIRRWGGQQ
jgi:hypothetical protein